MIYDEQYDTNGQILAVTEVDLDARTITFYEHGVFQWTRALTDAEIRQYGPQPLDPPGVIATLLVVNGVLDITDAANAVHRTPQDLINEAEGWAAAEGVTP